MHTHTHTHTNSTLFERNNKNNNNRKTKRGPAKRIGSVFFICLPLRGIVKLRCVALSRKYDSSFNRESRMLIKNMQKSDNSKRTVNHYAKEKERKKCSKKSLCCPGIGNASLIVGCVLCVSLFSTVFGQYSFSLLFSRRLFNSKSFYCL